MSYEYIHLQPDYGRGLGTTLCMVSFLQQVKRTKNLHKVYVMVNGENITKTYLDEIKALYELEWLSVCCYNIEQKEIFDKAYGLPVEFGDFCKLFGADYIKANHPVNIDDKNKHPYVAMCVAANSNTEYDSSKKTEYPFIKYNTPEYNSRLFWYLKNMGYDVLTIDSLHTTLSEKRKILEKCHFAVGYEGGIAHFCHTLNIPFIMTPWKVRTTPFFEDLLHIDRKTWFLRDSEEIFSWDADKLSDIIGKLYQNRGNNVFTTEKYFLNYDKQNGVIQMSNNLDHKINEVFIPFETFPEREYIEKSLNFTKRITRI